MELPDPRSFDDFVVFGVALELAHLGLVDVRLDVVAEVREEQHLALAVPQVRMVQHISEHEVSQALGRPTVHLSLGHLQLLPGFI